MAMFPKRSGWAGLFVASLIIVQLSAPARAGFTFVGTAQNLGASDSIDWGALGAAFTLVPNPTTALTTNMTTKYTVSQTAGTMFERVDEGLATGWIGIFAPDAHLLWTNGNNGPITVRFDKPLFVGGAQVQATAFGAFVARITALDMAGNPLGGASFTAAGNNTSAEDNTAPFLGIRSDQQNIYGLRFSLDSAAQDTKDLAIGSVLLTVPEPSSLTLLAFGGLGLLGLGRFRLTRSLLWRRASHEDLHPDFVAGSARAGVEAADAETDP